MKGLWKVLEERRLKGVKISTSENRLCINNESAVDDKNSDDSDPRNNCVVELTFFLEEGGNGSDAIPSPFVDKIKKGHNGNMGVLCSQNIDSPEFGKKDDNDSRKSNIGLRC